MTNSEIISKLSPLITDERLEKLYAVLEKRTRFTSVIIENIYQSHNASAVLRTCDCFGVQDVYIIENSNEFEVNEDIALGAYKWLDIHHYNHAENNTTECVNKLKAQGYTIVATTPHTNDVNLEEFPIDKKFALMFGTELNGLSDIAMDMADVYMKIPMHGFTESFNISVSAAICMHDLTYRLRNSNVDWKLNEVEKEEILAKWLKSSVKRSDIVLDELAKLGQ